MKAAKQGITLKIARSNEDKKLPKRTCTMCVAQYKFEVQD